MNWLNRTQRFWRAALLALLVVSLAGPWVYDQINVPARYPCDPPNIRLEGDFCGLPISAAYYYSSFILQAGAVAGQAVRLSLDPSALLFLLFLALLAMPVASLLLLVLRRHGGRLRGLNLAALLLACLPLALLGLGPEEMPWPGLWGYWTYAGTIACALALETLALRSRRKPLPK